MGRRDKFLDVEQQHRLVADFNLQRHIVHRRDCDGQLPMFDAPLPEREATPAAAPQLTPAESRPSTPHIDFLKRVLVAKYLRRCLKMGYATIGQLLNVDKGTACRLDHYKLAMAEDVDREAFRGEDVLNEYGMTQHEGGHGFRH